MSPTPTRAGAQPLRRKKCVTCLSAPAAMAQVDYCFTCWPGGPVVPPPCLRCGSRTDYYTSGICRLCHRDGHPGIQSCLDCYAWGAGRLYGWVCLGCNSWRRNNTTVGPCLVCNRHLHLRRFDDQLVCRLCFKQASTDRVGKAKLEFIHSNRHGQQLYLADTFFRKGQHIRRQVATAPEPDPGPVPRHHQLVLFDAPRQLSAHGRAGLLQRAHPADAAALIAVARDLSTHYGWSERQFDDTCDGLRIVLGIQDNPGLPIKASEVTQLRDVDLPAWTVLKVLEAAHRLIEDRAPALDTWFAQRVDALPSPMRSEVELWFDVMRNGSPTPPRRRPRSEETIRVQLHWALPTLHAWAAGGHISLREISKDDVLDALPPSGNPRSQTGQGLKSLFRLLNARKVLFTDPTSRVKTGERAPTQPMPADVAALRTALNSPNPARAAVVALIAFHGVRAGQLQRLHLTDIRDGRLHLDGRVIVLAEPVRERLSIWLDERATRWPNTANAHLFIHYRTAGTIDPVGRRWIGLAVGDNLSPAAIRADRILDEATATNGDTRRLSDLFGLSIQAGTRYTATIEHPDLRSARITATE